MSFVRRFGPLPAYGRETRGATMSSRHPTGKRMAADRKRADG